MKRITKRNIIDYLDSRGFFKFMSDEAYLKFMYKLKMKRKLNLSDPQTFNEKLQWLKIYDRKPEYTTMVDKYEAKKYVADIIGEEYIIPTLGVWDRFEDIDFDELPDQFVLKCTHDSGGLVICRDKSKLDLKAAKKKINKSLKRNYYWIGREWPYKNVRPRIIAEKFMRDGESGELRDYKIFNFNGLPDFIQVDFDRFGNHRRNLYTTDWTFIPASNNSQYPFDENVKVVRPKKLDQMLDFARILSAEIPHLRTDFYYVDEKIYFGELTFFHGSGFARFEPDSFDRQLGEKIVLPTENN